MFNIFAIETDTKIVKLYDTVTIGNSKLNQYYASTFADFGIIVCDSDYYKNGNHYDRRLKSLAKLILANKFLHTVVLLNINDGQALQEIYFNDIKATIINIFKNQGFNPNSDITVIPCISNKVDGFLKSRPKTNTYQWYKGPTVVECLDNFSKIWDESVQKGVNKITIDKQDELNDVIGKIEYGEIYVGDPLMKGNQELTVKEIIVNNSVLPASSAGTIVKLKLNQCTDIPHGSILSFPECTQSNVFNAYINTMNTTISALSNDYWIFINAEKQKITITNFQTHSVEDDRYNDVEIIKKYSRCYVRVISNRDVCINSSQDFPRLSRFLLLEKNHICGYGNIA
uniref:GTP-eEF1A C-terminal domain-containing protein n=1 Tax=Panagrolaimus superbus TaxID=310955 RepID=A0A914Y0S4_9BILA